MSQKLTYCLLGLSVISIGYNFIQNMRIGTLNDKISILESKYNDGKMRYNEMVSQCEQISKECIPVIENPITPIEPPLESPEVSADVERHELPLDSKNWVMTLYLHKNWKCFEADRNAVSLFNHEKWAIELKERTNSRMIEVLNANNMFTKDIIESIPSLVIQSEDGKVLYRSGNLELWHNYLSVINQEQSHASP